MKYSIEQQGKFTIIRINENIEFYKALSLKKEVGCIELSRNQVMIFEMENVNTIDSFGFGFIVTESQKAKLKNYPLRFVSVNDKLKHRMIQIIKIEPEQFFDSIENALNEEQ